MACNVRCIQRGPSLLKTPKDWRNLLGCMPLVQPSRRHPLHHHHSISFMLVILELIARQVSIVEVATIIAVAKVFQHLLRLLPHQNQSPHYR
jgi:hypothetical protein